MPTWLAQRVAPQGFALATDLDVSRLSGHAAGWETRRHDVGVEEPPPGPFDLVHARLVLVHVPRRAQALASLVRALRPGGWLVIEDADAALQPLGCPDERSPADKLANRLRQAFRALLAERGADLAFGRTLPRRLREAGLCDVRAEVFFPLGSPECARLERSTIAQVRTHLLARGLVSEAEIEAHLKHVASGRLDLATAPLVTAWGRKPAEG